MEFFVYVPVVLATMAMNNIPFPDAGEVLDDVLEAIVAPVQELMGMGWLTDQCTITPPVVSEHV